MQFVPRVSSRQQSSLIGEGESALSAASHAARMNVTSLSSCENLSICVLRNSLEWYSNDSASREHAVCYVRELTLSCRVSCWFRTSCERMGFSFGTGEKFRCMTRGRSDRGEREEGRERGLSHKYLRAIRCLLVCYRVYMVCRI